MLRIIVVVLLFCIANANWGRETGISFIIKEDKANRQATILLTINDTIRDSVTIEDLDFEIDSLAQINDSTWTYIYSFGSSESHSMRFSRQILLQELNGKIHFPYVSLFRFKMGFEVKEENRLYIARADYILNLTDSIVPHIKMNSFKKSILEGDVTVDSTSAITYLKFDPEKRVYYSSRGILDGAYELQFKEPERREYNDNNDMLIYLKSAAIFELKIGRAHYIYYKDRWFIYEVFGKTRRRLTPLIPIEEE